MQSQHTLNVWLRPSQVILQDGSLRFEFKPPRFYSLASAYSLRPKKGKVPNLPHLQFVNATSDEAMLEFAWWWGPLWLTTNERAGARSVVQPLAKYQAERRWFAAVNGLIGAVDGRAAERASLAEYFDAVVARERYSAIYNPDREDLTTEGFRLKFTFKGFTVEKRPLYTFDGPLSAWVVQANMEDVRAAIDHAVETSVPWLAPVIRVVRRGRKGRNCRKGRIETEWQFLSLAQALEWMVGQDLERRDPIRKCADCTTYFKSRTKHWRRYCHPDCAQRASARKWRKEDLRKKREAKAALEKENTRAQKAR
jgi:hypothetical protein